MAVEHTPITGGEALDDLSIPLQALFQFYKAFNQADLELMAQNWAHSAEIVMDNPLGGVKRGWEEVRSVYETLFNSPAKVYVEFYDYSLHPAGELFYAVGKERGEFRKGDRVISLAIRTSRIYSLREGRWRQVHHHGSIENPELLAQYQQAVRG